MNQLIKQDPEWPDIKCVIVIFILYHLWSHVLEGTAKSVTLLHVIRLHTPTKITNFDDVAIFDQYVLWLDISMNKPLLMQVVNTRADLNEKVKCRILT